MHKHRDRASLPYSSRRFLLNYTKESWGIEYSERSTGRCAEMYLCLSFRLHEHANGIAYYKKHVRSRDIVDGLHRLLWVLVFYTNDDAEASKIWIKTYEEANALGMASDRNLARWYDDLVRELDGRSG
ncbi:MAG: hypothetical protein LBD25_03735 [Coriobacteriales bacterium]|jgi:hypothetical protein|nr:hypothetical protein [Coriobacteriales bacterium]